MYLPILQHAWRIACKERQRWPFALFAGLLIGTGIGSAILQTLGTDPSQGALGAFLHPSTGLYGQAGELWTQARATSTGATIALIAYGIVITAMIGGIFWFAVVGANALMLFTAARDPVARRAVIRRAARRFWHTAATHIILKVLTVVVLIGWSMVFTRAIVVSTTESTAAAIIVFVLAASVLSCVHIVTPYTIAGITIDERPFGPALREAFALLRDRFLITIEASVLLTIASVVGFLVWIIGSFILAIPFALLFGIALAQHAPSFILTTVAAGLITLAAYLIILTMMYTTFLITAWALLYVRLTSPGAKPEAWLHRRFAHYGR